MMPISRRAFLGGAAGTAVAGGGAWAALLRDSLEAAAPAVRPSPTTTRAPVTTTTAAVAEAVASSSARLPVTERVLVVLEMDGGNDALNTLVPAVGRYHDARPEIGLSDGQLVTLTGAEYGLHLALAGLTPFWEAGTMSAIAGVAMPQQSRSHFTAKDAWWSVSAVHRHKPVGSGVGLISAAAERNGVDDPLRAIALGGGSPALVGAQTTATAIATRPPSPSQRVPAWTKVAWWRHSSRRRHPECRTDAGRRAEAIPGTLDAVALLAAAADSDNLSAYENPTPGAGRTAVDLLSTAANIIAMGIGTRVLTVGVRGFDTHADQSRTIRRCSRTLLAGLHRSSPHSRPRVISTG